MSPSAPRPPWKVQIRASALKSLSRLSRPDRERLRAPSDRSPGNYTFRVGTSPWGGSLWNNERTTPCRCVSAVRGGGVLHCRP